MESTKRVRREEETPKEEKEPKLKCHEMRLIFQRLPTSVLIRFISKQPKQPLGKYWSQELNFVIEKRLPFSIKATTTSHGALSDHLIFDCNGSYVAEIKRLEQFHLSPLCELTERAELLAYASNPSNLPAQFVFLTSDILSTLTSLDTLVLSAYYTIHHNLQDPVDLRAALNSEVMSRIHSLTLTNDNLYLCDERFGKPALEIIGRATNLKKLSMPYVEQNALDLFAALPNIRYGYSGLEYLSVKELDVRLVEPLLEVISSRFKSLRELFLPVRAPIRRYLAAFQVLPSLTTLGLSVSECYRPGEKELSADENIVPIVSVTELFIAWISSGSKEPRAVLSVLAKFPNVRTFGADFHARAFMEADSSRHGDFLLQFASAVCSSGVFTHLQALKLFCSAVARDGLLQFIRANIYHLPSSVDLSQLVTVKPRTVDRRLDFLVDLCLALQGGRITSLALKDFVHRGAVPRLREYFALTKQVKSTPKAKVGKLLAWIDEDSNDERRRRISSAGWWPQAVSDFTDFRIEACKTSGPLKGSAFKVRISDWTEERGRLF